MEYEVLCERKTKHKHTVTFKFGNKIQAACMPKKKKHTIEDLAKLAYKEVKK